MPSLLPLVTDAVAQRRPELLYGYVSTTKPAPASFADPLFVVFPQWRSDQFFQIDHWVAVHGFALPQPGAEVVVLKDSTGTYRCVYWEGAQSPVMPAPFCNKLADFQLA